MAGGNIPASSIDRRKFIAAIGAAPVAAGLAGCLGDDQSGGTPTTTTDGDQGGTTDTTTAAGDAPGDHEFIALGLAGPGSIDPAKGSVLPATTFMKSVYDPLLKHKRTEDDGGPPARPQEHIVTDWEVQNPKEWTFTIRDDVTFHRSGNTMTAEDVVYTIDRFLRIGGGLSGLWSGFIEPGAAEVIDETTFDLTLEKTYGPLLPSLSIVHVLDSATVKENQKSGEFGEHGDYGQAYLANNDAGSGPYMAKEVNKTDEIVYEAFDDYWGGWNSNQFGSFRHKYISEESTQVQMMKQGNADMPAWSLSQSSYNEMRNASNITVPDEFPLVYAIWELQINTQKAPTDDIHVRKALAHAFNYQTAVNDIMQGGEVCRGPVPVGTPGHNDELQPYEHNLDKARAELDKSKYSIDEINDAGIEFMFLPQFPNQRSAFLLLNNNLKELGITGGKFSPVQWPTLVDRVGSPETTSNLVGIYQIGDFLSPIVFTYNMYHPSQVERGVPTTMHWYTNDELTGVLEDAVETVEREQRLGKFEEAQRLIVDGYPSIFVLVRPFKYGLNNNVGGYQFKGIAAGMEYTAYDKFRKGDGPAK